MKRTLSKGILTLLIVGILLTLPAANAQTRVDAITLNPGEDLLRSGVIDTANGFAYFGTNTAPGRVVKIDLSTFTRVGAITLNPGEDQPQSAVINTATGFAYFGTCTFPGMVVKIGIEIPPSPTPSPVGGVLTPVNKLAVLAPYLALVGLVGTASAVFAIRRKRKA